MASKKTRLQSLWHWLKWKYRNGTGYLRLFSTFNDVQKYRFCASAKPGFGEPLEISVRKLRGKKVVCRPGTSDPFVLWDVFFWQYHIPPDPAPGLRLIVDLGANVGYTLAHWAVLYPHARIIGVELDEVNAELARRNTAFAADRCTVVQGAIWKEDGYIQYGGDESWALTILAEGAKSSRAVTMRTLLKEQNVDQVDLLKMDIEGAEDEIFSSDLEWLDKVQRIMLEIHPPADRDSIANILRQQGFECHSAPLPMAIWATR